MPSFESNIVLNLIILNSYSSLPGLDCMKNIFPLKIITFRVEIETNNGEVSMISNIENNISSILFVVV